jgi:hypothetical protein
VINELLKVALTDRDAKWDLAFTQALPQAQFRLTETTPKTGPDGWPYLFAEIDESGGEPGQRLISWLSTRGIGLVVNPKTDMPDFVVTYGMIWNYRERGELITLQSAPNSGAPSKTAIEFKNGESVLVGSPSEAFWPSYARTIVKQFLFDQGVLAPKILLILSPEHKPLDLCFSLESLGNPPSSEHAGIAEALAWFFPAHYSLVLISEKVLAGFVTI